MPTDSLAFSLYNSNRDGSLFSVSETASDVDVVAPFALARAFSLPFCRGVLLVDVDVVAPFSLGSFHHFGASFNVVTWIKVVDR